MDARLTSPTANGDGRPCLRGVYFLANDRVGDLARAFLNSFRAHNPTIPLCFIPFDHKASAVARLSREHHASHFCRESLLQECDAISRQIHGNTVGHYRKLVAWEGDFDEFIYIDVDTVVLASIDFVFGFLKRFDFVASHSNRRSLERWVWKPSIRSVGVLSERQIEYSANTGFIASRKGALTIERARRDAENEPTIAGHMNLTCQEQAFLNYQIVTSGRDFTSLALLASTGNPHVWGLEYWAGRSGAILGPNGSLKPAAGHPRIVIVHWAGQWQPRLWQKLLRAFLRLIGLQHDKTAWEVRLDLPYATLWKHYRWLRSGDEHRR